ncbi:MAG: hypothetical protein JNJ83_23315 [Verrucomicrobiaceae bacterium]|nr:hypothetical protein [Verrucomicrobiaceae bacterium]
MDPRRASSAIRGRSKRSQLATSWTPRIFSPTQFESSTANNGNYDDTDLSILHAGFAPRLGIDAPNLAIALDHLNNNLPSDSELDDLDQRAGLNWNVDYTANEVTALAMRARARRMHTGLDPTVI